MRETPDFDFFLTFPGQTGHIAGTWETRPDGTIVIRCYDTLGSPNLVIPPGVSAAEVVSTLRDRMLERARSARNSAKASTASIS